MGDHKDFRCQPAMGEGILARHIMIEAIYS